MGGHLNLGGRVDPQLYQQSDPALAHSLLAQQANGVPPPFGHQIHPYAETEFVLQQNLRDNLPTIDTGFSSQPDSKYGSPRDDTRLQPLSPVGHLSVLDAPMPASFDSQGISYMARHGPVAASVPSKFGLESPPSSLSKKAALPTDAVRNLHSSAFGRESRTRGDLGSSPLGSGDESFGPRIMHSKRVTKPSMISASLPRARAHVAGDWEGGHDDQLSDGEDYLPPILHDLLMPREKMRRFSRTDQDPRSFRESLSGLGTPGESSSKVGSPSTGSPSRYGALFARQKQEESNGSIQSTSAFGHVGSPLRNSSLHSLTSPSLRATKIPGDMSPAFASPPRQSSMSIISQQLARARISSHSEPNENPTTNSHNNLHPSSARHSSVPTQKLDRIVSSSSIGGTGRIEEEQGDFVFSMEEDEEDHRKQAYSGSPWGYNSGKASPRLGAIGTRRGGGIEGKDYWS